MSDDTQELVSRAQQGDREAFGILYERFAPKLYSYFYHRLDRDAATAEDLAEEAFVKVLTKLHLYQERAQPFSAWLYRVAANLLIDHVRARPKQGTMSIDDCRQLAEPAAERALDDSLTSAELAKLLECLTDEQRQVITLRFLQGCSGAETAAAVGKSEDAVKKLQFRGLQALKKALRSKELLLAA
jgi:RNA polymerase sigma-70 factor (ECF subfamily)